MCRLDCPGEEKDRMVGFYIYKTGPTVSVKGEFLRGPKRTVFFKSIIRPYWFFC